MYLQKVKFSLKDFKDPRDVSFRLEDVTKAFLDNKLIQKNGYYYEIFKMDTASNLYSKCYLDPNKKFRIIEENYCDYDGDFINLEVLVNE